MALTHYSRPLPGLLIVLLGTLALVLSACGVTPSLATTSSTTTASVASASASAGTASITSAAASAAPSAAMSGAAPTVQVRIDSKLGTIMVDAHGMTLYKYAKDGTNTSACLDACVKAWPPLIATGTPTLPAGIPGTLATFTRSDGTTQVSFNGVPLYLYAKDQQAGQTLGQGVGGVWSVANAANTRSVPVARAGKPVSGAIQSVADGKVTLQDGSSFAMSSSTQVTRLVPTTLSDLKPGDYVAVTATRQPDGSLLASVVNIFPPSARGVANGQFPMTGNNLMTNADIAKVTGAGFSVTFPGGSQNVTLASNARITRRVAADQSALTPGARITASVSNGTAQSISVQ